MLVRLIIGIFCSIWLIGCTNYFFHPVKEHLASPEQYQIAYESIYFAAEDGAKLHGWRFPAVESPKAIVLFIHGNGENISTHSGFVYWLTQYQYEVYIFDYRGYGKSEGEASIENALQDIQSARNYVVSRKLDDLPLYIMGHSLGASLGIVNLAKYPDDVDGVLFAAPFSDYRKMAQDALSKSWLTWLIQWPASYTVSSEYNPNKFIQQLPDIPTLFLYSDMDQIISVDHVFELYRKKAKPKYIERLTGNHNTMFYGEENQQAILRYLNEWTK